MNTCKAALCVIRSNRNVILAYLLGSGVMMVAMCIGVVNLLTSDDAASGTFEPAKASVAIVDRDAASGHAFKHGIERALSDKAEFLDVNDNVRDMQDAVATDQTDLIVIIPRHYARDFADAVHSGRTVPHVRTVTSYSSGSASIAGIEVQGFIGSVRAALATGLADDAADAIDRVVERQTADLPRTRVVSLTQGSGDAEDDSTVTISAFTMMMGTMLYPMMVVMTLAAGLVVSRFNELGVRARLGASPQSPARVDGQVLFACGAVAVLAWLYCTALSLGVAAAVGGSAGALYGRGVALALIASLALTVMSLTFGFMVGQFALPSSATNGIANVASLCFVFLSGAWISPSLMPDAMVTLSRFTPGWWYVDAVYRSFGGREGADLQSPDWKGWCMSVGMVLLFAAVFAAIGLAAGRVSRSRSVPAGPALTQVA